MWSLFSGAINGLFTVIAEPVKQWQARKTLKVEQQFELDKLDHQAKVQRANATLELAKKGQVQDFNLDKIAMQNMNKSWKDELVLIIFLAPVVLAFIPGFEGVVINGFAAIDKMPTWYISIVVGMVVVIYGLRGLLRAYLQRTKG